MSERASGGFGGLWQARFSSSGGKASTKFTSLGIEVDLMWLQLSLPEVKLRKLRRGNDARKESCNHWQVI